jgi:positive regulator of sigma E activity
MPKSRTVSLLLTVLFGPLGLLYTSVVGGLLLTAAALLTAFTFVGPVVCWIFAIAFGDHFAHRHNQNVAALSALLQGAKGSQAGDAR